MQNLIYNLRVITLGMALGFWLMLLLYVYFSVVNYGLVWASAISTVACLALLMIERKPKTAEVKNEK